ncbi:hypothetical protein Tco_1460248 [Tanacetum coccineum]
MLPGTTLTELKIQSRIDGAKKFTSTTLMPCMVFINGKSRENSSSKLRWVIVKRTDGKEYEFSFADFSRLGLNDIEYMYLLKVQGKLHHLKLEYEIDFISALLLYIFEES